MKDLDISKEEFEKPETLTISVDCDQELEQEEKEGDEKEPDLNEEIDF